MRLERRAPEPAAARLAIYKMGQLSPRGEAEHNCVISAKVLRDLTLGAETRGPLPIAQGLCTWTILPGQAPATAIPVDTRSVRGSAQIDATGKSSCIGLG